MTLTPFAFNDLAQSLLECVCAGLRQMARTLDGHPGCPCRTHVTPGEVAWDACEGDDCSPADLIGSAPGQLTTSIVRTYPVVRDNGAVGLPRTDTTVRDLRNCGVPDTAVELNVTLLRCAPSVDETGCPPTAEELAAAAEVLHVDMLTVQTAIMCCLAGTGTGDEERKGRRFVLGETRVLGPQGGCVGSQTTVTVILPGCLPCSFVTEAG